MKTYQAAAAAHPNIAFIKYWGNADHDLRLPSNGSLSMNLAGLETRTKVDFQEGLREDALVLNGRVVRGAGLTRVSTLLDRVRSLSGLDLRAEVISDNNFPTGAGIASSASAFAALSLASAAAAGLDLSSRELSSLARTGSGSASRSVPGGFVEWFPGESHRTSYAESIAPENHWNLVDLIAVVSQEHKPTGSSAGHRLAETSPLQDGRIADAPRRLKICREALLAEDFQTFAEIVELDCNAMHAVMISSQPPLIYWDPATIRLIKLVIRWRDDGLPVCYTIDAGPNVHILTLQQSVPEVKARLEAIQGINKVLECTPGGPVRLLDPEAAAV